MDFELSDEQQDLRRAAAALLSRRSTPQRLRALAAAAGSVPPAALAGPGTATTGHDGPTRPLVDAELWAAMAEQGWPAVALGEEAGGLGLGPVEVAVLAEEVGRHLAAVPFTGTVLVLGVLERALAGGSLAVDTPLGGAPAGEWLQRLADGRSAGAVCWALGTGPGAPAPAPVVFGPVADLVAVLTPGPAVGLVALADASRPAAEPTVDLTRCLGWLDPALDAVPAGDEADAWALVDRAAAAVSAEMLGTAARVVELAAAYAGDRVQFGRPIGSFQAVKHRCADMVVDLEGMRSAAYYAAWAVGDGAADAAVAASAAKVWCSDAAARIMASGLQVHGGIGFTWEHDLHLYVKRSLVDQVSMGDARWHRDRLAGLLRHRVAAGLPVL